MYVCVCKAVTDSDIRQAVDGGVRSMRQLTRETGCSSQCGSCAQLAKSVLNEAVAQTSERLRFLPSAQMA